MSLLTSMHGLVQPYQELKGFIPSSRNNSRSIFHCFSCQEIVPYVSKLDVCLDLEGFITSDHITFFLDLKSEFFDTTFQSVQPLKLRILQMYHTDNVETYNDQVLHQLKQYNIPTRRRTLQRFIQKEGFITK